MTYNIGREFSQRWKLACELLLLSRAQFGRQVSNGGVGTLRGLLDFREVRGNGMRRIQLLQGNLSVALDCREKVVDSKNYPAR
jgi:hypothetical protein